MRCHDGSTFAKLDIPLPTFSGAFTVDSFNTSRMVCMFSQLVQSVLLGIVLSSAATAQALSPCRVAGFSTQVECGKVQRALDPAQPQGVKIDVQYVVVPALARRKLPDPVFFLAGGPGQSAIGIAPMLTKQMRRLNNRRDLVFVDQRGTGRSAPLVCEDDQRSPLAQQLDPARRSALVRQCLSQLQKLPYGDVRFFTTYLAMQDIDAVRIAIGAPQINLIGGSYGTRAALEYTRQFPQHVRRMVIDGVAPPDAALPASVSTDSQAAFNALLAACEQDANCQKAYPKLRADWATLLAQMPQPISLAHPLTGAAERLTLTREMVLASVRGPLYSPALTSALPYAITQAAQGRYEALMGLSGALASNKADRMAIGMHFSVICAEDMPRLAASTDKPGADFGSEFGQLYTDTCAYWPRGTVPEAFYTFSASSAPALVLSGGLDPVTPVRHGARVAKALGSKAQHVVVPNAGHGVITLDCMSDVLFRFIDTENDAQASAVDAACVKNIPRPTVFMPVNNAPLAAPLN
jgi:pimeloyl-ACP methyl ester carboxylesterase